MGFEPQLIEKMKREYTDKYVVVDGERPELARFRDVVGRVKTVNMSGRALVEFDDYNLNIGWYDIDPEFLKVVDKPPPKEKKAEAKKAAPKADAKPAAAKAPAAKAKPAAGGGMSVAEMLAAARGGGGTATPAVPAKSPEPKKPAAAPKPATGGKMSVAEMLAAARGSAGGAPAAPAPAAPAVEDESASAQDGAAAPAEVAKPAPAAKPAKPAGTVDRKTMTVADMIAYCREHDAR